MSRLVIKIDNTQPIGGYLVTCQSQDKELFGRAIDALKSCVPASARSWQPNVKTWRVEQTGSLDLAAWLWWCEDALKAGACGEAILMLRLTWANTRKQSSPARVPRLEDDYTALFVLPDAPFEVVRAAYRALAQLHHPDRGGSVAEMQRVNRAFESIERARMAEKEKAA